MSKPLPILCMVIPCYNEEQVLPLTAPLFLAQLDRMIQAGKIHPDSRILLVDDGSRDGTWEIVSRLSQMYPCFLGIRQSRNRGHQNAVWAGLMEAKDWCDITISIDCDGQDDIAAMEAMVDAWAEGCDIVYGVRSARDTDTFFKRASAECFYRLLCAMGVECEFNHADYRLLSARALAGLAEFEEVNLFLRGLVPLVGYKSTSVCYERTARLAGESHYPLRRMLGLALDGITSLSIRPIRLITALGFFASLLSLVGILWSIIVYLQGKTVAGWASMACIVCFMGGVQLLSMGILGEYIGKIYLETKRRPRCIISERTGLTPSHGADSGCAEPAAQKPETENIPSAVGEQTLEQEEQNRDREEQT